ncbi:MAG: hypothetical protein Q7R39_00855, partial [Dehalococcoidia bacterium]|nr:hypothetical protein [Dehalococcoidia bacterium]
PNDMLESLALRAAMRLQGAGFISVITEADLPPSPLLRQKVCLGESCSLCLQACPGEAIQLLPDMDDSAFALSSFSRTNKQVCRESGVKNFCKGVYLKSCPVGQDGW